MITIGSIGVFETDYTPGIEYPVAQHILAYQADERYRQASARSPRRASPRGDRQHDRYAPTNGRPLSDLLAPDSPLRPVLCVIVCFQMRAVRVLCIWLSHREDPGRVALLCVLALHVPGSFVLRWGLQKHISTLSGALIPS